MIAARIIEPVIAVVIDAPADRSAWYQYNHDYLDYLERVVKYIDGHYATQATPDARLHAGTSAGGRASAYVGFELPEVFRNIAMLSPSLSLTSRPQYFEPYLSGRVRPHDQLRIWMSAGTYEAYIHQDVQDMQAYCERIGLPTRTLCVHRGHSFGAWREAAIEAVKYFFPAK